MKYRQIIIGCLCWLGAALGTWAAVRHELDSADGSVAALTAGIAEWLTDRRTTIAARSDVPVALAVGDPVLMKTTGGKYRQVGVIRSNFNAAREDHVTQQAIVNIYNEALALFPSGIELHYHMTPTSLDWAAASLLPPERQRQVAAVIAADWKIHQAEILRSLTPIVQESVQRTIRAVETELPAVMEKYRNDFTRLGERYKTDIVRDQILPLVKGNIQPIVEEEVQPLISEIGRHLWNRVSLWSFTWRYFYDVSPLPQRDAVKQEFERFLQDEALPELRSRTPQFVEVTERIVSRISQDPEVNATIRRSLRQISSDPELHSIIWRVIRDTILQNESLRQSLDEYWNSEDTRRAMQLTSTRFEPAARTIGDLIIGSREKGITPEFSRILRAQILLKDRHWLVLAPAAIPATGGTAALSFVRIVPGGEPMPYPISFERAVQSPLSEIK